MTSLDRETLAREVLLALLSAGHDPTNAPAVAFGVADAFAVEAAEWRHRAPDGTPAKRAERRDSKADAVDLAALHAELAQLRHALARTITPTEAAALTREATEHTRITERERVVLSDLSIPSDRLERPRKHAIGRIDLEPAPRRERRDS